eukprot:jgi/Mesen1/3045/ME000018S02360
MLLLCYHDRLRSHCFIKNLMMGWAIALTQQAAHINVPCWNSMQSERSRAISRRTRLTVKQNENGIHCSLSVQATGSDEAGSKGVSLGTKPTQRKVIKLIATDVDGTLLNSKHELTERTEQAIRRAQELGVKVMVATGKARGPWTKHILPRLNLTTPGVYMQGLLIHNADGSIFYERVMEASVARSVIELGVRERLTILAYCGDRILCESTNEHTDRMIGYGEPVPEAVGPLINVLGSTPIHKLLFMAEDQELQRLRPEAEALLGDTVTVTKALLGMLEILPAGASKGLGLEKVLQALDIDAQHVMAIGDGENDKEMLELVGTSVAMGNAGARIQAIADLVTRSNDADGVAVAIEHLVL